MKATAWSDTVHAVAETRHRRTVGEYEAERKKLIAKLEERDSQLDAALELSKHRPKVSKIKLDKSADGEATAVVMASDWHAEETIDPKTVNGLNAFNLKIAETRIKKMFQNAARLTNIQRHGVKIDRLVLFLGGDLMTGYIHEELQENNQLSPTETVLWLLDNIASGLKFLQPHFSQIVIPCCYGNHGRNTRKPRHATGAANSYEWMLYHLMARQLPEYEWHIADGYHLLLDLYNKTIRAHHGDGLKYQGGIGGLTIPVEKAIASWNKGIAADLDIFGHWHQSQQSPKWVCNGSLVGHNAYSVAIKAPYEPPSQTYFLFDKRYGRTGTFPILLD